MGDVTPDLGNCPTCGETADSPDAGPCDGNHDCLRRLYDDYQTQMENEYLAEMTREANRG